MRILSHYIKIWRGNPLSLKNQGGQGSLHPFYIIVNYGGAIRFL